jgi:hypothetical protein
MKASQNADAAVFDLPRCTEIEVMSAGWTDVLVGKDLGEELAEEKNKRIHRWLQDHNSEKTLVKKEESFILRTPSLPEASTCEESVLERSHRAQSAPGRDEADHQISILDLAEISGHDFKQAHRGIIALCQLVESRFPHDLQRQQQHRYVLRIAIFFEEKVLYRHTPSTKCDMVSSLMCIPRYQRGH